MQPKPSFYIVKNDDNSIRFFIIGYFFRGVFTGMMHDYTGSGNYEEKLVYRDQFLPDTYLNGESIELDDQVDLWEKLTGFDYIKDIESYTDKRYTYYDTSQFNYVAQTKSLPLFIGNVLIDNCSLNIPYGLGNTSFIDGYEICTIGD